MPPKKAAPKKGDGGKASPTKSKSPSPSSDKSKKGDKSPAKPAPKKDRSPSPKQSGKATPTKDKKGKDKDKDKDKEKEKDDTPKVSNPPSKASTAGGTATANPTSQASQPVSDDERQQKLLIKRLAIKTTLDEHVCEEALAVCGWDYEEAKRLLEGPRGTTPSDMPVSRSPFQPGSQFGQAGHFPEPAYEDLPPPPQRAYHQPVDQTSASFYGVAPQQQHQQPQHQPQHQPLPQPHAHAHPHPQPQPHLQQHPSYSMMPQASPPATHGHYSHPAQQQMPHMQVPQMPQMPQMPAPVIPGMPQFPDLGGAPSVTAEQLIGAITKQPWILPGVLGGIAAHKEMQQGRSHSRASTESATSYEDDVSELVQSKHEQQVQFTSPPSPPRRSSSMRSARPSYDRNSDMELLLDKVRSIEVALERANQHPQQQGQSAQQAPLHTPPQVPTQQPHIPLPPPPPPPPPMPATPLHAAGLVPKFVTPAHDGMQMPTRSGPPAAHRQGGGDVLPGHPTAAAPSVLGGFLSALPGDMAGGATATSDAYAKLLSRQQDLMDQTKDKQERARITQLERELEGMKNKLLQSQHQQIKQLEVVRSIQEQVNENRQEADVGLQQVDKVTADVQQWADDLYTRQQEHVERRRNDLLDETRERQRRLAQAIQTGQLSSVADLTREHKDLVEQTGRLAERRTRLARGNDPLMQAELQEGLGGIGDTLRSARTKQDQSADLLSSLAQAMGAPPSPPPPPVQLTEEIPRPLHPSSPSPRLAPAPYQHQAQLQPPVPEVVYPAPDQGQLLEAAERVVENKAVLGELQTLKDVLRLLLHHQMEQAQVQEDMMQRQNDIMERTRLDELHAARKSSLLLQGLAQQQQQSIQRDREARALEQELVLREQESRERERVREGTRQRRERERERAPTPHTPHTPRMTRTRSRSAARRALLERDREREREAERQREAARERQSPRPRTRSQTRPVTPKTTRRHRDSPKRRFAQDALMLSTNSPRADDLQRSLHSISTAVQQLKAAPSEPRPETPRSNTPRGEKKDNPHRATLIAFYEKHNAAKVAEVDTILEKFAGHYNVLFHSLAKTYNIRANPYRDKLIAFYSKHNPDKLCEVDVLLHLAEGREEYLLKVLDKRYTKSSG